MVESNKKLLHLLNTNISDGVFVVCDSVTCYDQCMDGIIWGILYHCIGTSQHSCGIGSIIDIDINDMASIKLFSRLVEFSITLVNIFQFIHLLW